MKVSDFAHLLPGNCVEVYHAADKYSLLGVQKAAAGYMRSKFTSLPEHQLKLLTLEQITGVVESDALLCSSEWQVFNKVGDTRQIHIGI